jgi:hypothetical protein
MRPSRRGETLRGAPGDLLDAIARARSDYREAQAYFQIVSETELVDQAIHLVAAAEKKLLYLLRKAREEGVASVEAPGGPREEAGA